MNNVKTMADAYRLQKAISEESIQIDENGIKVIVSGDQKIKQIVINGTENPLIAQTINKAIRKAQEVAAIKLKGLIDQNNLV